MAKTSSGKGGPFIILRCKAPYLGKSVAVSLVFNLEPWFLKFEKVPVTVALVAPQKLEIVF